MVKNNKIIKKIVNCQLSIVNSSQGQTLVEALAAIAIAVVIVTAMVSLGIGTQRAANTSRTQTQNTKYGEQAMEIIRSIRDSNNPGAIANLQVHPSFSTCTSTCKFTDLYSASFETSGTYLPGDTTAGVYFLLYNNDIGNCPNYSTGWCLRYDPTGSSQSLTSTYSRKIRMWDSRDLGTDPYTSVKYVEVAISWTDSSGTHTSKTFTKLTNFK